MEEIYDGRACSRKMSSTQHICEDHLEQATRDRRPVTVRELFLRKPKLL